MFLYILVHLVVFTLSQVQNSYHLANAANNTCFLFIIHILTCNVYFFVGLGRLSLSVESIDPRTATATVNTIDYLNPSM